MDNRREDINRAIMAAVKENYDEILVISKKKELLSKMLESLENELDQVSAELSKPVSEDLLLEGSVEQGISEIEEIGNLKNRQSSLVELIKYTKSVMEKTGSSLEKVKESFAGAMRGAAVEYTKNARNEGLKLIDKMFSDDDSHREAMAETCASIMSEVGVEHVYFNLGLSNESFYYGEGSLYPEQILMDKIISRRTSRG